MIAKNSLTGSGFYGISEAPKILLLKFWFLYFQFFFLVIFLIPLLWLIYLLKIFLIYKIVFSQFLVFYFAGVVVGWRVIFCLEIFQVAKFSQPAKFRSLRKFASPTVHLPCPFIFSLLQTLRFLCPPLISFLFEPAI